jgi:hypothetical protein
LVYDQTVADGLDLDALVSRYEEGASASSLGRDFGVSTWTVLNRLRGAGVHIRSNKEQNEKRLDLDDAQQQHLIEIVDGLLLGDGSIDPKGILRIEQTQNRLSWFDAIQEVLGDLGAASRRTPVTPRVRFIQDHDAHGKGGAVLYTPAYVEFQEQRKRWYPKGKKRVPEDLALSPLSIAYWLCGDGTYDKQGALFFCTNSFLKKETQRLAEGLTEIGIRARCVPVPARRRQWKIAITERDAAQALRELVEDHVPQCFQYKFAHVRAAIPRGSVGAKLTFEQAQEIRKRTKNGETQTALAEEFSVSQAAVSQIVRGKAHKENRP